MFVGFLFFPKRIFVPTSFVSRDSEVDPEAVRGGETLNCERADSCFELLPARGTDWSRELEAEGSSGERRAPSMKGQETAAW